MQRIVALGEETLPELGGLGPQRVYISRVFQDIVGTGSLDGIGNLVRQAEPGIGFGGRASSLGAVSYTHLDVYKRQGRKGDPTGGK